MGINIVDSVNARVSQTAVINLTDDPANCHNGYAVHSASSTGTTVDGLYVERVRHATDDNAVGTAAGSADPSKYGADLFMHVTDVVANGTTSPAFSWHTEGREASITDSVVFNSNGVLGARGLNNSMSDVAASAMRAASSSMNMATATVATSPWAMFSSAPPPISAIRRWAPPPTTSSAIRPSTRSTRRSGPQPASPR